MLWSVSRPEALNFFSAAIQGLGRVSGELTLRRDFPEFASGRISPLIDFPLLGEFDHAVESSDSRAQSARLVAKPGER